MIDTIRWEIEPRCNLNCKHCFVADTEYGSKRATLEENLSFITKMYEIGIKKIVYSTREPLLYDGIDVLTKKATSMGMAVSLVTNGILLDDYEICRGLVVSGIDEVFVSLEGITASSNDFIRGEGTLDRVMRGLKNLAKCAREEKKLVRVFIQMSINQLNKTESPDIPEFFNNLPIDGLIISAIGAAGNAAKHREIILSQDSETYIDCCKTIVHNYLKLKTRKYILGFKSLSPYDVVLINHEYGTNFCPYLPGCSAMDGTYSLLPSGEIIPCISLMGQWQGSSSSLLKFNADDYGNIFSPALKEMRKKMGEYKEDCASCFLLNSCCLCPAGLQHLDQLLMAKKACQKSLGKFLEMLDRVEENISQYYVDFSGSRTIFQNNGLLLSRFFTEGIRTEESFEAPFLADFYRMSVQQKSLSYIATEIGADVKDIIHMSAVLICKGYGRIKKNATCNN